MRLRLLFLAFLPLFSFAQTSEYNKFSIEIDGGLVKPFRTFTPGYSTEQINPFVVNLGARYMFNTKIGIKGDVGYHNFENAENSNEFSTEYYRGSLQGVINIGNLVDLKTTGLKNLGLLLHAGAGLSAINFEEPIDNSEWTAHSIIGLTPQIKLGERVTLQADVSLISNVAQNINFDGVSPVQNRFLDGSILTTSLGLAFNLGKASSHADWTYVTPWKKDIDTLTEKVAKIEKDLIDTDQDGVADYLDREPNTAAGASVNTKGITEDLNNNGIPDEYETSLDRKYLKETPEVAPVKYEDLVKELINEGYVNVYFNTNSSTPSTYSLDSINFIIEYMKKNTSASADIIGYADQRGAEAYNTKLSERRAKKVMDILTEAGIEASRLTNLGQGESPSANTKQALQLNRKVTFKLK